MAHSHTETSGQRSRAVAVSLAANAVLLVAMVVGFVWFGSLALLADAAHQASDVLGLLVAFIALRLSLRPRTSRYTYGMRRAETLGAVGNGALLLASGTWIVIEGVRRVGDPPEIDGGGVMALALIGIVVNTASAWLLHRVAGSNLNLRAAMLHLGFDAAASVGVLVAGFAALVWSAYWVDPVMSFVLAALVLWSGWRVLARTTRVLLEAAPLDATPVAFAIERHPDVTDVHHLHLWSIDSEQIALSAHVVVDRAGLHEAQLVSADLQEMLRRRFGIEHATLALECHRCDDTEGGWAEDPSGVSFSP